MEIVLPNPSSPVPQPAPRPPGATQTVPGTLLGWVPRGQRQVPLITWGDSKAWGSRDPPSQLSPSLASHPRAWGGVGVVPSDPLSSIWACRSTTAPWDTGARGASR